MPSAEQVPPGGGKAHGRSGEGGRPIAGGGPAPLLATGIHRRPGSEGDAGDVREVHHPPLDADSARDGGAVVLRPATSPLPGRAVAAAAAAADRSGAAAKLLLLVGVAGIHQEGRGLGWVRKYDPV